MLLPYRLFVWLVIAFEGANALGFLHVPILEPTNSWKGQALYHVFGYALFELLWWIGKRMKLSLSPHIFLWLIVAIIHNLPGTLYGLFTAYAWYDQVAHFMLMGFFLVLVMYDIIRGLFKKMGIESKYLILVSAFCATMTLGVANEVFEYLLDQMGNSAMIPAGIANDTANDLVMNSLGAILFISIAFISTLRKYQSR